MNRDGTEHKADRRRRKLRSAFGRLSPDGKRVLVHPKCTPPAQDKDGKARRSARNWS